jgi:hypothetical protein
VSDRKIGFIFLFLIVIIISLFSYSSAYNYENVTVSTRVNVTNAYPAIDFVRLDQNVLLNAGSTKIVTCNVSLHDWNGYGDIRGVNATLWDNNTALFGDADNSNNHYVNTNCSNISQSGYYANYSCNFSVWYFANNGSNWLCNATVMDSYNFTANNQNSTTFRQYYALNITTSLINYGDMVLASYSPNITVNITNIGNGLLNISVLGYGGNNSATGNGYAMFCQSGNITIGNERFSTSDVDDWSAKTPLSSTLQNITGLSISKTTISSPTWNIMYWQLYTDPTYNPFGLCNGTVEFDAYAG